MFQKPRFKHNYRVEGVGSDGIVIITERDFLWVSGDHFVKVSPYLNGDYTSDEIVEELTGKISMPEIYYALSVLEDQGHIVESSDEIPPAQQAFWHFLNLEADKVTQRLKEVSVEVINLCSSVEERMINESLSAAGMRRSDEGDFGLVIVTDYDSPEIVALNERFLKAGMPWLLVKPVGIDTWIGPLIEPGETACWQCMLQRLRANRQLQTYVNERNEDRQTIQVSVAELPFSKEIMVKQALMEALKFIVTGDNSKLKNTLLTIDQVTNKQASHTVFKRPQCPVCGEKKYLDRSRDPVPVLLATSPKKFMKDGGHRSATLKETYERFIPHVSEITGVVTNLTRLDRYGDDGLIFTYSAGHNFAMMENRGMRFMMKNLRGRSGGKGMSEIQAQLSGLCEAIERYSGVFRGDEIVIKSTYNDLGEKAIEPTSYLMFSENQYAKREEINTLNTSDYHKIPLPFPKDREIEWAPLWSLTNQQWRYVPAGYCYFGHPDISEYYFSASDANGNAAGNTIEEAILQGFLELIERDAVGIWWYNRLSMPSLDIKSFDIPYANELVDFYREGGREIWVLDITNNMKVHTFAAVSRRVDKPVEDIVLGFGAHLDPKIALLRALTEVNQFMPCVSNEGEDGATAYWYDDPEAIHWWKTATIEKEYYLVPDKNAPVRTLADYPDLSHPDLKNDVEFCVQSAADNGMETFVLDQTRPDIGLNVVKVMVPGLRHFWKRFSPGRLYDVPLQMSWADKVTPEEELNPIGIFF